MIYEENFGHSIEKCPYCGNKDLWYDVVQDEEGCCHDIVDCYECNHRLYYEEY